MDARASVTEWKQNHRHGITWKDELTLWLYVDILPEKNLAESAETVSKFKNCMIQKLK